jgi:hypothetical protein
MFHAHGSYITHRSAKSTAPAFVGPIHHFLLTPLAFGIVTPKAPGRTALEEDGGPYSRAIVNRIPSNVEDLAARHLVYHALSTTPSRDVLFGV